MERHVVVSAADSSGITDAIKTGSGR